MTYHNLPSSVAILYQYASMLSRLSDIRTNSAMFGSRFSGMFTVHKIDETNRIVLTIQYSKILLTFGVLDELKHTYAAPMYAP